jgi:hypothetical protein
MGSQVAELMASLKVVQLREHSLLDIPNQLRALADRIESGEEGGVTSCGCVVLGDRFEVYGWGEGVNSESNSPSVFLLFQAAIHRMARNLEQTGL